MLTIFHPDPNRARELNKKINAELADSLAKVASAVSSKARRLAESSSITFPRPVEFGLYYELATATRALIYSPPDFPDASLEDQTAVFEPGIRFTTLSRDFYSSEQISSIRRWLDTEPDNALDLVAVESKELEQAADWINTALRMLAVGCSDFFHEFQAITREIILAKPNGAQRLDFRGVSSFALWGSLALNPKAHSDWVDYVSSLVHESAHSLLFGLARKGPLVLNGPTEVYMSPLRQQPRPMDGIYHAAFVSAREFWVLDRCISNKSLRSLPFVDQRVLGSLIDARDHSLAAFKDCLGVVRNHARLTDLGNVILEDAERSCRTAD